MTRITAINHYVSMRLSKRFAWLFLLLIISVEAKPQNIMTVEQAQDKQLIDLYDIRGTGGSTGTVIEAVLRNLTNKDIRISTNINRGLFLRNSGKGQNMIATQIYRASGEYFVSGEQKFSMVEPFEKMKVLLFAYCADFEKDNPTPQEKFTIKSFPQRYSDIVDKISRYSEKYPKDDSIVKSGQVALWMSQGHSLQKIREKFEISDADAELAYKLLQ